MGRKGLTVGRMNRLFGFLLAIFWVLAGILFWQNHFDKTILTLAVVVTLVGGILFVFGTRSAQKDGFLDGYTRAKDEFDKKKKT